MDLTPQQLEKDVKRLNERINEVVKLLGADSEAYQKYVSKIKSLLPSQFVRVDKDGLFKIARKKEIYNRAGDEKIQRAFEQLLKVPTAGKIKAHAKQVIMNEKKKALEAGAPEDDTPSDAVGVGSGAMIIEPGKPTNAEIIDKAKQIDIVEQFVTDNQEMFYVEYSEAKYNDIIHTQGKGRRTYDELERLIKEYKEKKYKKITTVFSDVDY